jgi:hypothetical protein
MNLHFSFMQTMAIDDMRLTLSKLCTLRMGQPHLGHRSTVPGCAEAVPIAGGRRWIG